MAKPSKPGSNQRRKAPNDRESEAPFRRDTAPEPSRRSSPSAPDPKHRQSNEPPVMGARVNRRAADRLRSGHLWVYASDLESVETGEGQPPSLLPVADSRGLLLGTALYSPSSQIALRMVSRDSIGEAEWLDLLARRLFKAVDERLVMLNAATVDSDSCRLCFSEADDLPGLVIDKYGELVILQFLARGLDSNAVRKTCVETLLKALEKTKAPPVSIFERPDPRIRELEGLAAPDLAPLWAVNPEAPITSTQFQLNGLNFHYDANAGQKTGAFLDQSANYKAAEQWAWKLSPGGRALDVCTYQGGFALHLARVSETVTGIDSSRASLEVAERNLAANRDKFRSNVKIDWVEGDAFQILRDWAAAREQFDTIVLDPPAFAKSKRAVEGALRGYKELNLRAMQMLKPSGLLVTCSCSHHVSLADFEAVLASAAIDAHRRVRLLQRRGAAPDHPVILNLPETEYLKCLVLEVE